MTLSVVIPAYNEAQRIVSTLDRIAAYVDAHPDVIEVIVVDDGSQDQTPQIAGAMVERIKGLRVLRSPKNCGKGHAVRWGMMDAVGDLILMCDADLATPIEEVEKLTEALRRTGCAVSVGSRALSESHIQHHQPLYRERLGKFFNRLVQMLCVPGIKDTQCGFKLFTSRAAKAIFSRTVINGFAFDVEALVIAHRLGFGICETAVRWSDVRGSKVVVWRHGMQMIKDLLMVRVRCLLTAGQRGGCGS